MTVRSGMQLNGEWQSLTTDVYEADEPGTGIGGPWPARVVSLVFLVLACFALPPQAAGAILAFKGLPLAPDFLSSVNEGDTKTLTVVAYGEPLTEPVTLIWTATALGNSSGLCRICDEHVFDPAEVNADLLRAQGTVTVPPGTNSLDGSFVVSAADFTIHITDDDDDEPVEQLLITLSLPPGAYNPPHGWRPGAYIATYSHVRKIIRIQADPNDTETAPVAPDNPINLRVVEDVTEADRRLRFRAELTARQTQDVTLSWRVTGGTASADDFQGNFRNTGTVTIPAGRLGAPIRFTPFDDDDVEGPETLEVTIAVADGSPLPPGVTIRTATATATINDTDTPAADNPISLRVVEDVTEADERLKFRAELTAKHTQNVTLSWRVTGGTASADDFDEGFRSAGTVTIRAGRLGAPIRFTPFDDDDVEGPETLEVTVAVADGSPLPPGVTIGTATATATINDTDTPAADNPINLTVVEDVTEADRSLTFRADLTAKHTQNVTLSWRVTGGTASADDFHENFQDAGTVTIAAGRLGAPIRFAPVDDGDAEGPETLEVTIAVADGSPLPPDVTIGTATATATIDDADAPAADIRINLRVVEAVQDATDPDRRLKFRADLTGRHTQDVILSWSVTGGTASADDFDETFRDTGTVTIAAERLGAPIYFTPAGGDDGGPKTLEVTIAVADGSPLPPDVTIGRATATATIGNNGARGASAAVAQPAQTRDPSVLIEPRRTGAGTALRRHASRFDSMTGTVVRNRLKGSGMHDLSFSADVTEDSQDVAVSSQPFDGRWGSWIDGAWAGVGGNATGLQADIYGGMDYLGAGDDWLIGALIGYEIADLEVGEATIRSDHFHFGLYGGALLSRQLLFDGAVTLGMATPEVAQGGVSASYDANRITARGALTGNFGRQHGREDGSVRVEPQLGLLYSRETLDVFTDSDGGAAEREILELGRFSAGPRLTWAFEGGQMTGHLTGSARMQWDFLDLDDGVGGRFSGAADIGVRLDLAPGVTFGIYGDVDGIGIGDDFSSLGGKVELSIRF